MGMGMVGSMPPGMMVPPGMGVARPLGMGGRSVYAYGQLQQQVPLAPPSQPMAATTPEDDTTRLERKVKL